MSTLNAVSILLSIGVIASKSWVVAYSSHAPTMAFNALCIVADVLSLFASIAWLFALPPKLHELASSLRGFLLLFVGLAVCSGALFFLLFCARRSAPLNRNRLSWRPRVLPSPRFCQAPLSSSTRCCTGGGASAARGCRRRSCPWYSASAWCR